MVHSTAHNRLTLALIRLLMCVATSMRVTCVACTYCEGPPATFAKKYISAAIVLCTCCLGCSAGSGGDSITVPHPQCFCTAVRSSARKAHCPAHPTEVGRGIGPSMLQLQYNTATENAWAVWCRFHVPCLVGGSKQCTCIDYLCPRTYTACGAAGAVGFVRPRWRLRHVCLASSTQIAVEDAEDKWIARNVVPLVSSQHDER